MKNQIENHFELAIKEVLLSHKSEQPRSPHCMSYSLSQPKMKTFLSTVVLITLVIVNANGAPSVDAEEILENKSLLEQVLDVLNEEKAEAEVRKPVKKRNCMI